MASLLKFILILLIFSKFEISVVLKTFFYKIFFDFFQSCKKYTMVFDILPNSLNDLLSKYNLYLIQKCSNFSFHNCKCSFKCSKTSNLSISRRTSKICKNSSRNKNYSWHSWSLCSTRVACMVFLIQYKVLKKIVFVNFRYTRTIFKWDGESRLSPYHPNDVRYAAYQRSRLSGQQ